MILYADLKEIYPSPEYLFTWDTGNKIVIRKNGYNKGEPVTYFFYLRNTENDRCQWLFEDRASNDGEFYQLLFRAEKHWNKKPKQETYKFSEEERLEQVQSVLLGMVKKNRISEITCYDFMFSYYGNAAWVCWVPTAEQLVNYHLKSEQTFSEYLDFLKSDVCKNFYEQIQVMREQGTLELPFSKITV